MNKRYSIKKISIIGVMAAMCFAASMISIDIPTVIDKTRLHLGNVLCLMSGIMLGPVGGGLAAGIGSMFFDLANPRYVASAPFTLVFKFTMAFVCGSIVWKGGVPNKNWLRNILACAAGAMSYVILYLGRSFIEDVFFLKTEVATALIDVSTKAAVSGLNAVLAVIAAVPLAVAVRKALERAGLSI